VQACLTSLYECLGAQCYTACLARPENRPANTLIGAELSIVLCVSGDNHLVSNLDDGAYPFEARHVEGDPRLLGYACHEVLRERLGDFDYYAYMEDDLVLSDPWFITKLRWFSELAGNECILQPNRFELAQNGRLYKCYIDGDLPPEKTSRYQDVSRNSELTGHFLGTLISFQRTLNPHAGCFFLSDEQMRCWAAKAYFLDRDASFYSPLEGAATVGIMRTFRVYKPAGENASFLEIRHMGSGVMSRIAVRDLNWSQPLAAGEFSGLQGALR
jgi:hypothetical protein